MAEEQENSGNAQCDGDNGARLDPENGRAGAVFLSRVTTDKALDEHFLDMTEIILEVERETDSTVATLLLGLAVRANSESGVQEEECQSLAEVLWKAYRGNG